MFRKPVGDQLFPYVEFVKRDGAPLTGPALRERSIELLRGHLRHRPKANPITAWREALPEHFRMLMTTTTTISSSHLISRILVDTPLVCS